MVKLVEWMIHGKYCSPNHHDSWWFIVTVALYELQWLVMLILNEET